jgi:WbqC-like protein family
MRTVAIHQPNFLPWLGFFDKLDRADVFVLLDGVQFVRRSNITRVDILHDGRPLTIGVPVRRPPRQETEIREVSIDPDERALRKLQATLRTAYGRAPFFDRHVAPAIELLARHRERLVDLNVALIRHLADGLGIAASKLRLQSELAAAGRKSELMASLTRAVGGTVYLSGRGAAAYNDAEVYSAQGVELRYQDFSHPRYDQGAPDFVPGLSALDALARLGPRAMDLVRAARGQ